MNRNLLILAGLAALALATTGCDKLKARDNLNKGVQAYKNAKYPEAVAFFQKAVELDPSFKTTHLYLATAYMSQYIPGAESPENVRMADSAYNEFQNVLKLDPKDELATASIASLYFNQKKMDEAKEWNRKLIAINPQNKDVREELKVKYRPLLDEGVADMQKALDIDKEYNEAMAYMNLLIRYRADLDDSDAEYKKDIDEADMWMQKS